MNTKKIFIVATGIIIFFFLSSVVYYAKYIESREQRRVDTHGKIIANAMWNYDTEGIAEYLHLASTAYNYKHVLVTQSTGETVINLTYFLQKPMDKFLFAMGLLPTKRIESDIHHKNQIIGKVTVTWHNKAIYQLSYAFLVVLLLILILWFFLRTARTKQELEVRVEKRTIHLQKEIAERKQTEQELQQYAQRLAVHVDQTLLAVIEFDLNFKIIQWNQAAENIFGYTYDEAVGHCAIDLIVPETAREHVETIWKDLIANKGGQKSRNQNITKDGSLITCKWYNTTLIDSNNAVIGVASLVMDISEAEYFEAQLRQSHKMEAIGTLAGGIAHDFNNILAAIIGYTEMARDETTPESPIGRDLEEIYSASTRAKELVKQILVFSKQSKQELKPVHLHIIAKEALKLLRSSIPTTIEIRQNIDHDSGAVLSDPTQIHQIIINLCTNAYHAMREKGGILAVSLRPLKIELENHKVQSFDLPPGQYVELAVSDTGIGMDKETLAKIFDPYFTTKNKGEGTGLGLSVVHGIIKSYNGHINVYSEPEKGTTFRVYLPKIDTDTLSENSLPKRTYPTGDERILIVDDEEIIVNMVYRMLKSLGYQVTAMISSTKALKEFKKSADKFDLLITDMTMPNMNGVELIQRIRSIRPEIPIILCTGFSELVDKDNASILGIHKFLMKPVIKMELAEAVRQVLDENASEIEV